MEPLLILLDLLPCESRCFCARLRSESLWISAFVVLALLSFRLSLAAMRLVALLLAAHPPESFTTLQCVEVQLANLVIYGLTSTNAFAKHNDMGRTGKVSSMLYCNQLQSFLLTLALQDWKGRSNQRRDRYLCPKQQSKQNSVRTVIRPTQISI